MVSSGRRGGGGGSSGSSTTTTTTTTAAATTTTTTTLTTTTTPTTTTPPTTTTAITTTTTTTTTTSTTTTCTITCACSTWRGVTLIQTKQKRTAREQRNKYKPITETRTTPSNQTCRQAGGFESWNCLLLRPGMWAAFAT